MPPALTQTTNWITTTTLLDQLQEPSNRSAWDGFAGRFRKPVVRFARKMGLPAEDAEDAAQETLAEFSRAYGAGRYDRSRGRLRKWLFGIAYRQIANVRRRLSREAAVRSPGNPPSACLAAAPDAIARHKRRDETREAALLQHCLELARRDVDPDTYRAFELVVLEQQSPAQAASTLGVPVKSVYNAKHRILGKLRRLRGELALNG
ncbi:MAG: RNA polymerase sigma factor [Phycisphaerae bacterium]